GVCPERPGKVPPHRTRYCRDYHAGSTLRGNLRYPVHRSYGRRTRRSRRRKADLGSSPSRLLQEVRERSEKGHEEYGEPESSGTPDKRDLREVWRSHGAEMGTIRKLPGLRRISGLQEHERDRQRRNVSERRSRNRRSRLRTGAVRKLWKANGTQAGALWAISRVYRLSGMQDDAKDNRKRRCAQKTRCHS